MVLGTIAISAQGTVSMTQLSFAPGETKKLSIELADETLYTAFQMDLALPAGFSIATTINEDEEEVLDIAIDAARKKSSHQLSYNKIGEGVYRMAAFSSSNATFKGTSGAIVNISVTADAAIAGGKYVVELKNVAFTTPDAVDVHFDAITATFEVQGGVSGDYTAEVNCAAEGDAMLSASVVAGGSPLKLLVAPKDGYRIASLLLNGNAVDVKDNVYNVASVEENMVFDVTFEEVLPDTVQMVDTLIVEKVVTDTLVVEKIVTDTLVVEKIVTDTLVVEKIVTDTLVVEKIVTDTIEIETIETDTVFIAEVTDIPVPEIEFADGMMSIKCALAAVKIYYATDGTFEDYREYTGPVAIDEDCKVMAYAVLSSDKAEFDIIGTGIGGVADEIVSRKYYTEAGVEISEPVQGVNILVITYSSGKTETKKVVVRKK